MTLHIRRVVTGHDADGKAVIVADGEAPRSWRRPSGLGHSLCWVTDAMPVDNAAHADGGDQDIGIPPPPHGSVFRIIEFPPEGDDLDHADPTGQEMLKAAGAIVKGDEGLTARHPGMHKTNTIDYAVILSGEIDMLVDEDEVHLKAGDALSSMAPIMRGRIGGQSHAASRLSCSTRRPYLEQIPLQARSGACRAGQRRVGGLSAWPASEEGVIRQPTERENAQWRRSLG